MDCHNRKFYEAHLRKFIELLFSAPGLHLSWTKVSIHIFNISSRWALPYSNVLKPCYSIVCVFSSNLFNVAKQLSLDHYSDVIMSSMASQITSIWIVCSNLCSGADQRKHHSSAPLASSRGIHRWQVNSPHKGPVTRKMFPFDDVIMIK